MKYIGTATVYECDLCKSRTIVDADEQPPGKCPECHNRKKQAEAVVRARSLAVWRKDQTQFYGTADRNLRKIARKVRVQDE